MAGDEMEMTEEDAALAAAIDAAQDDRLADELGPIFWAHGHGGVVEPKAMRENRERVEALIERDKADRIRERDRKAAELEVGRGNFINLADTVVEPTPEWQERVAHRSYTPKQSDGTVREVRTVRAERVALVFKMHAAGKLADEHFTACMWYRDCWEQAGLRGRVKSSLLSLTGNVGGGGGGDGQAPMALHEFEALARNNFRAARESIAPSLLAMFDAVVLRDVPLTRAQKFVRCRENQILQRFRAACSDLCEFIEAAKIDTAGRE